MIRRVCFLIILLGATTYSVESAARSNYSAAVEPESRTVLEVLKEIESMSNYIFFYQDNSLDLNRQVSVEVDGNNVERVLEQIFAGTDSQYYISGRQIVISNKQASQPASAQQNNGNTVTGTVRGVDGAIVGAFVSLVGTGRGAITDVNGGFSLPNVPANSVLEVSLLGYVTQRVTITTQSSVNVVLEREAQLIDELVVIGYGVVRKSDLTGSVSSVKGEELAKISTFDPVSALQGRAAGVTVINASGSPDGTATIRVRGMGTPNNTDPLYVVDGFPMNDIRYLSPNDIQSIEVLKDASATAIYGSRGSNGVVVITTTKGQAGPVKVAVRASYGFEGPTQKITMLNARQYEELANEAFSNAGVEIPYPNITGSPNTNWWNEVSRVGRNQNYNISLSGGSERLTTMMSVNYWGRDGIIKSTNFDRLTFTQNSTFQATRWMKLTAGFSGAFSTSKYLDQNSVFLTSLIAPSNVSVWNDETNYYTGIDKFRVDNPAGRIARNNGKHRRRNLIGTFAADLNLLPGLTFRSHFGIRDDGTWGEGFSPIFYETQNISTLVATMSRNTSRASDWTWENYATYQKDWNDVHSLTVMAGMTARDRYEEEFDLTMKNLPLEGEPYRYFDNAPDWQSSGGSGESISMLSYYTRFNYGLLNRYLVTFTMRADGSSRFIESNRWGYFPSGAFSWKISEEPFFKDWSPSWWNNAGLRVGYGQVGNERTSSVYPHATLMNLNNFYTLGVNQSRVIGASAAGIGNPNVRWETTKQFNVGLDLSFFKGKFDVTADYYIRRTDDILLSQQIPRTSGFANMTRNVGGMENRGIELSFNWRETKGDFSYSVGANASYNMNKVTNLGSTPAIVGSFAYDYALIDLQGHFGNMLRSEVGRPWQEFHGYVTDGIFKSQAEIDAHTNSKGQIIQANAKPGDFRFKDLDDNGSIGTGDMAFIGSSQIPVQYGLSFDASYKGFDVSVLFQGAAGGQIYNAAKYYFMRFDGRQNVRTEYLDAYWSESNSNAPQPALTQDSSRNSRNYRNSDFFVEDGSYLKLRNLQLGYTFKPDFGAESHPSIRVYVSAQNLLTLTGYSGFEPEIGTSSSVDRGIYPQSRSFMIGTSINF